MGPAKIHTYRPETPMWPAPANSFVLKDARGAVLIDAGCGYRECYQKIRDFLAGLGLEPGDVHTVVLSHAHPDHMGALPFLLEEASPRIIIHSLEKTLAADNSLLNKSFDMCHITDYYMERLGDTHPASIDILDYFSNLCPMGAAEATDTVEGVTRLTLAAGASRSCTLRGTRRAIYLFSTATMGPCSRSTWWEPWSPGTARRAAGRGATWRAWTRSSAWAPV